MPKLSLIMPAYNSENTCIEAIESIIINKSDFELIIIDDGSWDDTFTICSKYAQRDERIKVYRKENGGVSSARNFGLNVANGEYIGFVDADDRISAQYINTLFPLMETKVDVIVFGYKGIKNNKKILSSKPIETRDIKTMYEDMLIYGGNLNSPWNKLFKKSLIHHKFNEQKSMGEDLEFCCEYLKNIQSCIVVSDELYIYTVDSQDSLTKKLDIVLKSVTEDIKVLLDFLAAIEFNKSIIEDKFYQRTEGILANIYNYKSFYDAICCLFEDEDYVDFMIDFHPNKIKNKLLRGFMIRKKYKLLYIYLLCKRLIRRVVLK